MHDEFMAFVLDEASMRAARSAAEKRGLDAGGIRQGGLEMLADMLEANAPPRVLLLDLDDQADPRASALRAIDLTGPDCHIIFAGLHNDVSLYRHFIHIGAVDYLVKPLSPETLMQAIVAAGKPHAPALTPKDGHAHNCKIIPIIGVRGGVGATTLAVNLAWAMAHPLDLYVGLVDLDMHFGTTALALDREPGRGMRAALENPERLDGLLIASSMVQESQQLSILCAEEALDHTLAFDGDTTLSLIKPVRGDFDFILVDLPRHALAAQKRLLAEADQIVIVCDFTLPSLRDARRVMQFIKAQRPELLPHLIVNHAGTGAHAMIDQPTFEKNIEAKVDTLIQEDAKTARQAANLGKAVVEVAPDSAFAKSLMALARHLAGIKKEKKAAAGSVGSLIKGILHSTRPAKPAVET
jgi:pilus assembly protein CpaE